MPQLERLGFNWENSHSRTKVRLKFTCGVLVGVVYKNKQSPLAANVLHCL